MKTTQPDQFSEEQIIEFLKEVDAGMPGKKLCRRYSFSKASYYHRRSKFGGMDASLKARMKELEEENRRLKKMYAEERLKAEIIQEAMAKKVVKPSQRKDMAVRLWPSATCRKKTNAYSAPVLPTHQSKSSFCAIGCHLA